MSQNPRGSDPYDYNPDYNRLNEQYNQNGQCGQNTKYGQGSYGQYGQPMMVPVGFCRRPLNRLLVRRLLRLLRCSVLSA